MSLPKHKLIPNVNNLDVAEAVKKRKRRFEEATVFA